MKAGDNIVLEWKREESFKKEIDNNVKCVERPNKTKAENSIALRN